jgi:hypothetical protein
MDAKKQTAVEWLVIAITNNMTNNLSSEIGALLVELFDEALAMEKEQIEKAYNESWRLRDKPYLTALQYYNETYNK